MDGIKLNQNVASRPESQKAPFLETNLRRIKTRPTPMKGCVCKSPANRVTCEKFEVPNNDGQPGAVTPGTASPPENCLHSLEVCDVCYRQITDFFSSPQILFQRYFLPNRSEFPSCDAQTWRVAMDSS